MPDPAAIVFLEAQARDAKRLTALALRSKAYWGYDEAFIKASEPYLTLTPYDLQYCYMLTQSQHLIGFYCLEDNGESADVSFFFIDPAFIHQGYGRRLWQHMQTFASNLGFSSLTIESDPHAQAFYERMGATQEGKLESEVLRGRFLPVLRFLL